MLSFPPPFSRNEGSATVAQIWHQLHEVPYRRVPETLPAVDSNMYFRKDMTEQQVYPSKQTFRYHRFILKIYFISLQT
jgi:hypothetical protein